MDTLFFQEIETGDNTLRRKPVQSFIEELYSWSFSCDRELENYLFYNFTIIPYEKDQFILNLNISRYERSPLDNVSLCEKRHDVLTMTQTMTQTGVDFSLVQLFSWDIIPMPIQELIQTYDLWDTMYQRALEMFAVSRKDYGKCSEEICSLIGRELYFVRYDENNPLYAYYTLHNSWEEKAEILVLWDDHVMSLQDREGIHYTWYRQFINQDTIGYRLMDKPKTLRRKELQYVDLDTISFYSLYPNIDKF